MRPRPAVLLLCAAVVGAIAFAVDRLIVTDREAVTARLEGAFDAAKRGDWDAFASALDEDCTWDGADKAAAVARAKRLASAFPSRAWRLSIDDVAVSGDRATVKGHVALSVAAAYAESGYRVDGRADLVKRGGTWRIASIAEGDPALAR